jgi:DNA-binding transcriptional LysR family regulator
MIMVSASQTTRRLVDRTAAQSGIKIHIIAQSDSIQATRDLLISGVGYSVVPCSALIADVQRGLIFGDPHSKVLHSLFRCPAKRPANHLGIERIQDLAHG